MKLTLLECEHCNSWTISFQLSINMKEEKELILYPNKNGTVKTLLEEAAKQIELNPEEGSGQLRILEVSGHKLLPGPREDDSLECKRFFIIFKLY